MNMIVCSTLDRKAKSFGPPMLFQNVDIARRMASSMMDQRGNGSDLEKYPEDFDLYLIGDFDTSLGLIAGHETPQFLFTFGDLVRKEI